MKKVTIVAFGDSLTYGYGVLVSYPARLRKVYPKYNIRNRGINGDCTRGGLARLEEDVLSLRPNLVVVWFGSNDSCFGEGYRTPIEFEQNLSAIVEGILNLEHSANKKSEILLITPPPMIDSDFYPINTNDRLVEYAKITKSVAQKYHCNCLDFFSILDAENKVSKEHYESMFQQDDVHLSDLGYELLWKHLLPEVEALLK
ncbi:SGNH/GDSL hydrolase family protein [Chakrabartyella piscis]|uniref:SGNH/GDSL hydrolase family protein n=1 Tax=Chakrabartyella piscis TaxID=2918914 RepID=UPI002958C625|nr:GDSL-type esterase/lipase family protein [Chakrabartyella piscis]